MEIFISGTPFEVAFDYQPFEPMTRDTPGQIESIDLHSIKIGNQEIDYDSGIFRTNFVDRLEEAILAKIKQDALDEFIDAKTSRYCSCHWPLGFKARVCSTCGKRTA
ncbi:MAG: hypothetical protein JEZ11_04000 [Desulfobacterales bacterium]|nr:hypothetical protein [Desulfobacterales bacterium]